MARSATHVDLPMVRKSTVPAGDPSGRSSVTVKVGHILTSLTGRVLRHRFSSKATSVATPNSLPKGNDVTKAAPSSFCARPCFEKVDGLVELGVR